MLVAYYLRRGGQSDFLPSDLGAELNKADLPTPSPSLDALLEQLTSGRRPPFVKIEGTRFSLSADGVEEVENLLREIGGLKAALDCLDELVGVLAPEADERFLPEVKLCVQDGTRRAAVVMMWLLTMDHLERYVITHKLPDFNTAMLARSEYRGTAPITAQADFEQLRNEKHFIEILGSARIVSSDVKKLLEDRLGFRNTCAHPNPVTVSDAKLVSFVDDLVHNVILKLPL